MSILASSRRALPFALVALGAALAFQMTRFYTTGLHVPFQLLVIVLALVALIARPKPFVLLLLTVTYVVPHTFSYSFGGISTDIGELIAYGLVASWLLHLYLHRREELPSYSRPMLALLLAIFTGVIVGLYHGVDTYLLRGETKAYLLYFALLPLVAYFGTMRDKRLLERWVVLVATVTAAYVLALLASGNDPYAGGTFNTLGVLAHAQRIKPPGLEIVVVAFMLVTARALAGGATVLRIAQLVLFLVLFAFSFYRSIWIGLLVGVLLLVVIVPGRQRGMRALRVAVVIGLLAPLVFTVAASGHLGPSAQAVTARLASTISPKISQESSFTDRSAESAQALRAIARSPIVGVGIAVPYGADVLRYDDKLNVYYKEPRQFSHNSYLQLYLQVGLLGLIAMGGVARQATRHVQRALQRGTTDEAVLAAGAAAALLAIAVKASFNTQLLERPAIFALLMALTLAHTAQPSRQS